MGYGYIKFLQKLMKAKNSFEPKHAPSAETLDGGIIYVKEIEYAKKYPNSFLDLYLREDAKERVCPTYIFVHGGGYTWGDKDDCDAKYRKGGNHTVLKQFVKKGYNVAVINYALAPEYPYPTPLLQLFQVVSWLQEHGGEYGVTLDRVVLGGGSAGGNVVGQFVNIHTNTEYAREMKMKPLLRREQLAAVVFNCALLDNERFAEVGRDKPYKMFLRCGQAYFHCEELKGNPQAMQSDVIEYATEAFPPTYITEANVDSFMAQAVDLDQKLTRLGVTHVLNMYPKEQVKLRHGYDEFGGETAEENLRKTLAFLEAVV